MSSATVFVANTPVDTAQSQRALPRPSWITRPPAAYAVGCSPTSHNLSVSIWFVFMTASSYVQSYRSHGGDIETHAAKLRAVSQRQRFAPAAANPCRAQRQALAYIQTLKQAGVCATVSTTHASSTAA